MASFIDEVKAEVKASPQKIVLPEGSDSRTLEAASVILQEGLARPVILGDVDEMLASGYALDGAELIDPRESELAEELASLLYELRKNKGVSLDIAKQLVLDPLYFGVLMVKAQLVDGMVAGACHATGDVLRPALQIVKTAPNASLVSSFFVMDVPNCELGDNGRFIFADCGLNVQPNANELAAIAVDSARSWSSLVGSQPKVAMLSHSSYGSAKNDDAAKVSEALKIAQTLESGFDVDGELQLDAALCSDVASLKCPDSSVAGHANVLIFPDLDAGNIGYKLVQRLARAEAYGPVTQGLAAPVNDLSRGCSASDIVGVVAITCLQAIKAKACSA